MCALEGAEAGFATATGMAAVFGSIFALLKQGDHLLCCSSVFGSTFTIVTKYLRSMELNVHWLLQMIKMRGKKQLSQTRK
jgi:cystathionine beta-lyase/cystathionine gamma-synthase